MSLWPPQQRGLAQLSQHLERGRCDVCVTLPTGGGKTRMIQHVLQTPHKRQLLLTGRRLLFEQTVGVMERAGVKFGLRAAGYQLDNMQPIQLAMIQTEYARRNKIPKHDCEIIHVDEAHSHKAGMMAALREYYEGASWVGWTATPLDVDEWYEHLVVAGNMTDLRACGAVVPAIHYGPDEPDLAQIRRQANADYPAGEVIKAMMTHTILGRVVRHYHQINHDEKPTILFAPGVQESKWFAQYLSSYGIPAAHIDGDNVWYKGQNYESDQEARREVAAMSAAGEIKIVCNRFVLREGIDWPWIEHGIFATVYGSLKAYLQSGGRILRQHYIDGVPQLKRVTIQDHGGNWWRHGSLNSDREWRLDHTDYMVCELREERLRAKKIAQPICCPRCHAIRLSGPQCPACGHEHVKGSRMVVQADGSLREHVGDIVKPRRLYQKPDLQRKWERCYWRAHRAGMTFNQARGLFAYEHNWNYPPTNLPLMPLNETDWFEKVARVPKNELIRSNHAQG